MSIAMACPGCGHILYAPAGSGGRKAQCTRCKQLMLVPDEAPAPAAESDFEVVDDDPPPRKAPRPALKRDDEFELAEDRPRKRPSLDRRDVDDDQEEPSPRRRPSLTMRDDDDPPRKRKGKKKKKSGEGAANTVLSVLGGIVVVAVVIGLAVLKIAVRQNKIDRVKELVVGKNTGGDGASGLSGGSSNWVNYVGDGFNGSFPGGAPSHDASLTSQMSGRNNGTAISRRDGNVTYAVIVFRTDDTSHFNAQQQKVFIDTFSNGMAQAGNATERSTDMTLFDRPGKEMVVRLSGSRMIFRLVLMPRRLVLYAVEGPLSLSADAANVTRFLNEFNVAR